MSTLKWRNFFQLKLPEPPNCRCEGSRWPFPCKDFGMASTSLWWCGWEEWAGWWGFGVGFRELETLGVSILQTWAFHAKGRLAPMASRFSSFWCVLMCFEVFKMLMHFTDCNWHLPLSLPKGSQVCDKIYFLRSENGSHSLWMGTSWDGHELTENSSKKNVTLPSLPFDSLHPRHSVPGWGESFEIFVPRKNKVLPVRQASGLRSAGLFGCCWGSTLPGELAVLGVVT